MSVQNSNDFNGMKWCPETELNRRHADFQSAALPTELSGHRWKGQGPSGGGVIRQALGPVQRVGAEKCRAGLLRAFRQAGVGRRLCLVGGSGGQHVAFLQPAAQVDVGTAARAERLVFRVTVLGADRAGHGSNSARGRRSRRRISSNRPSVVQPARLVSAASDLKAARST